MIAKIRLVVETAVTDVTIEEEITLVIARNADSERAREYVSSKLEILAARTARKAAAAVGAGTEEEL